MSVGVPTTIRSQHSSMISRGSFRSIRAPSSAGCLSATIFSAYDLMSRDPPSHVLITLQDGADDKNDCKPSCVSGPPIQRHRDRNAFKFQTDTPMRLTAALSELYASTITIELVYSSNSQKNLMTQYALNQLVIHDATWLILPLHGADGAAASGTSYAGTDDDYESPVPSIRLQLRLEGPYRTEIAAIFQLADGWFQLVDAAEAALQQLPFPDRKYVLIPAVPLLAIAVVSLPIVVGILLLGLPLFLPLAVVLGGVGASLGVVALALYASTAGGRSQVETLLQPLTRAVWTTSTGQQVLYETGPRPSLVQMAGTLLPTEHSQIWSKLVVSLLMDACGSATYLVPLVGEVGDAVWAPIQTICLMAIYNQQKALACVSFVEEILPLTDIVPTATAGWLTEYAAPLIADSVRQNTKIPDTQH